MKTINKLWIFIAVLVVLSPIGIFLPELAKAGAAWGEWGIDEIAKLIGYVPKGLERLASLWSAPMPDYAVGGGEKSTQVMAVQYILSAVIGVAVTASIVFFAGKLLSKKE